MNELIYLLACAVNGTAPDKERISDIDLEKLYRQAKRHSVRAAVCMALERAGISDSRFIEAKNKAVRKNIYFDIERGNLLAEFEQRGIWYLPLKGSVLKDIYPETGMREMADNDILYDKARQNDVKNIMTANGYKAESVGKGNHDVYKKPPVQNFELHTGLFGEMHDEKFYQYYRDPTHLMIHDDENYFGYHFSDEDFYVYMTAHEYKHFSGGGTGIRSLLDCYVYLKNKSDRLDFGYIEKQLEMLGIAAHERKRRELSVKIFSGGDTDSLSDDERELLNYYMSSGTYGTYENAINRRIEKQNPGTNKRFKLKYIKDRMFPDMKTMSQSVLFVNGHKVLYPAGVVFRIFRGTIKNGRKIFKEL